jgi:biotin carboxylase
LLLSRETYRATDFLSAGRALDVELIVGTDVVLAFSDRGDGLYCTLPFDDLDEAVARARALPDLGGVVAADEEAVVVAAAIASALGLRGHTPAAAGRTRDKLAMRHALRAAGLAHPPFAHVERVDEVARALDDVGLPCVVKPLGLSASRGVVRADDLHEAEDAVARVLTLLDDEAAARQTGQARGALLESFLPGDEVALEGYVRGGRLEVLALFDKPDPLDGPTFEETLYITPSQLSEGEQRDVHACVADAARAVGLDDGPVHAEVRLTPAGPTLVEVAARTIGGLCARTLRFGAGMSLEELVLRGALGRDLLAVERERRAAGVMMLPIPRAGVLRAVSGVDEARAVPGIEDVVMTAPVGRPLVPLPEGRFYLGFAFARGDTPGAVEQALRDAHAHLSFDIEAGDESPRDR